MGTSLASIVAALILVVPLGAFAFEKESVEFASNVEFIKGHLTQALANKQQGDIELAKAHAGHPTAEIFSLIKREIEEYDKELSSSLEKSLEELHSKVDSSSYEELQGEIALIEENLDLAVLDVVPEENRDTEFWIMVLIEVLETAEHEYEEAVSEGQIKEMIEYQDAQGFIARAEQISNFVAGSIDEHEAQEIEGFFADLKGAVESKSKPEQIATFIGGIVREYREIAGLEEEAAQPSIANIKSLLDELIIEYEEGVYHKAEELAIKAYLENYEFLEAEIEEKDPELMESTEIMLREELRDLIKERAPIEEVEAKVEEISVNLDKILDLGIGIPKETEGDPRLAYVKNIRMLLDQVVQEYEEGEYEEAMSFAVKAYLDNYEFLERDVKAQDEDLNEDVEQLLREELQAKIESRAPVAEVEALASEINAKLDAVEVIVPEFHAGFAALIASLFAAVILLARMRPIAFKIFLNP